MERESGTEESKGRPYDSQIPQLAQDSFVGVGDASPGRKDDDFCVWRRC
jgi:hypothetical protein